MKTVRQHFESLPEPYRQQAIDNTSKYYLEYEELSLDLALKRCFIWDNTEQGFDYWNEFYNNMYRQTRIYTTL